MAAAPGGRSAVDSPPSDVPTGPAAVASPPEQPALEGPAVEGPGQGELFPDPLLDDGFDGMPDRLGRFPGPPARQEVGITYRQLDSWARPGLVVPWLRGAAGSGSQRLYS